MIRFSCPSCGQVYDVRDAIGGKARTCNHCGARMVVPPPEPPIKALPEMLEAKLAPNPWKEITVPKGGVAQYNCDEGVRPKRRNRLIWIAASLFAGVMALGAVIAMILLLKRHPSDSRPDVDLALMQRASTEGAAATREEDNPADIACIILHAYPDTLLKPDRFPVFKGKTVPLAKTNGENVRLAIEWAKRGKSGKLLEQALVQAQDLTSEDKVLRFLLELDDQSFESLKETGSTIEIPLARLDMLSAGTGFTEGKEVTKFFYRMIERKRATAKIDFSYHFATILEAAFFDKIRECYPNAAVVKTKQRAEARRRQIAAREDNPALTAPIHKVQEDIGRYANKCVYFDQVWIGGDVERRANGFYKIRIIDNRGESYTGFGDEMLFVCSQKLADVLRENIRADVRVQGKIFCQVGVLAPKKGVIRIVNGREIKGDTPFAEVYKVQVYNQAGDLFKEYTEQGLKQLK